MPVLFADPHPQELQHTRDPVQPVIKPGSTERKTCAGQRDDGIPVHGFQALLNSLDAVARSTFSVGTGTAITLTTLSDARQQWALDFLLEITTK